MHEKPFSIRSMAVAAQQARRCRAGICRKPSFLRLLQGISLLRPAERLYGLQES